MNRSMNVQISVDPKVTEWDQCIWTKEEQIVLLLYNVLLETGIQLSNIEVSLFFTGDEEITSYNNNYRKKNCPTNVLSFPVDDMPERQDPDEVVLLGDIILSWHTINREALENNISMNDHICHLIIHGFLHLIGYSHDSEKKAQIMEGIESSCMVKLGFSDPYM